MIRRDRPARGAFSQWRAVATLAGCLVLAAPMLSACGTGGVADTVAFELRGIGPDGGSIAAGDVRVDIPAGSLAQETLVSILPQRDPLPIQPDLNDPCTYAFLGPLWCCGPVGEPLANGGTMVVSYDPSLIPPGKTDADLVLLLWDHSLMALVPRPSAVHDTNANTFTFSPLDELGHVAVGVSDCQFITNAGWIANFGAGGAPLQGGQTVPDSIYVGDADTPLVEPVFLDIGGRTATAYVASAEGSRIMFGGFGNNDSMDLFTIPTEGGSVSAIAEADIDTFDSTYSFGWWKATEDASTVFSSQFAPSDDLTKTGAAGEGALIEPSRDGQVISTMAADASTPRDPFHAGFSIQFLDDIRQAPDGADILVVWQEFDFSDDDTSSESFALDVVSTADASLTSDTIPYGEGLFPPRFEDAGTGIYFVGDRGQTVEKVARDGTGLETIFSLNDTAFAIQDFVISPTGTHFFAIVRSLEVGSTDNFDEFWYGTMGATPVVLERTLFSGFASYDDVLWHPTESLVYVGTSFQGVYPVELNAALSAGLRINVLTAIPTQEGISSVDVNSTDGRLLISIFNNDLDNPLPGITAGVYDAAGIWVAPPNGQNPVQMASPAGLGLFEPGRWLTSWRRAPTMTSFLGVR